MRQIKEKPLNQYYHQNNNQDLDLLLSRAPQVASQNLFAHKDQPKTEVSVNQKELNWASLMEGMIVDFFIISHAESRRT